MWAVKHLVKLAATLLTCSCDSSSYMVYNATFNSSVALPSTGVYGTFPDVLSNLESLGPLVLLSEPVGFQPVFHDGRTLRIGD